MNLADVMFHTPPDPVPEIVAERTEDVFGMKDPWRIIIRDAHVYTDGSRAFLLRWVLDYPTDENCHPVLRTRAVESVEQMEGEALEAMLDYWRANLMGQIA